ncbi:MULTISPECIES: helix-turn-helix domain-containing protein [Streptomyces]|uniref:helix-turn-helix domain-containing protein n=1 Tax=Streptomyces TaxID=1883 RepID=UPI0021AFC5E5|nr:XRE family transcriptional regulator [Streptomyces sp. WAC 01325]
MTGISLTTLSNIIRKGEIMRVEDSAEGKDEAQGPSGDFLAKVGQQVRARRRAAGLTVQALAERAGLSRRMLTMIEQGGANPSLVSVDKIARALGTDFTSLLGNVQGDPVHVPDRPVQVWESNTGSRGLLHVGSARVGGPELWEWTLQPGDRYDANPDPFGSEELFLVKSGTLVLTVGDRIVRLGAGASARLASDREYRYSAEGAEPAVFIRVVELGPETSPG